MSYEYYEIKDGGRQYDDIDVENGPVDARYVHVEGYEGNRLIEALPRAKDADEVRISYSAGIPGYRQENADATDIIRALTQLTQLKQWRFPLKYNLRLEQQFFLSQLIGYAGRKPVILTAKDGTKVVKYDPTGSAANEAFSLLGYSGSGKSTSIAQLLKGYPQVIRHTLEDGLQFFQITYLLKSCPVNSNMSTLLESFGAGFDEALGFADPVYEAAVKKLRSIGAKAELISELCRRFAVGTILIDEIQYMDFTSTKETSFNSLLTVVNESGTNVSVIGTEEAYKSMFQTLKMQRRTGKIIQADGYCSDRKFFAAVAKDIMQYQWFEEYTEPTNELIEALYAATGGIIDLLVTYWMYMNLEAIVSGGKKKVCADYVDEITEKHFVGLPELLADMSKSEADKTIKELVLKATDEMTAKISEEQERAAMKDIIESAEKGEIAELNRIRGNVVNNLLTTCSITGATFTQQMIVHATEHVMGLKKNLKADEQEISQQAYEWLIRNASGSAGKRKTKRLKADEQEFIDIQDELLSSSAKPEGKTK